MHPRRFGILNHICTSEKIIRSCTTINKVQVLATMNSIRRLDINFVCTEAAYRYMGMALAAVLR
jgi:energy-converting hydrogenase Eha subunit C